MEKGVVVASLDRITEVIAERPLLVDDADSHEL
jgi:hypothetical protein